MHPSDRHTRGGAARGRAPAGRSLAWLSCLGIAAGVALASARIPTAALDDAYISYRYARNLAAGDGLVFNAGERVEGYTNFLWVIVSALGIRAGADPLAVSVAVSFAAQAATLLLVFAIGVRRLASPGRALVAPLLLGCQPGVLAYPKTGMETSAFVLFFTLACWTHLQPGGSPRRGAILGGALLAVCLLRFDGAVLVAILAVQQAWWRMRPRPGGGGTGSGRAWIVAGGVLVLGLGAYHVFRIGYYGALLPNTFHAKVGVSSLPLASGLAYLASFLRTPALAIVALAGVPVLLDRRGWSRPAGAIALAHAGYVVAVGGDWMPDFRFLLPLLPLLCLLAQDGLWRLRDGLATRAGAGVADACLLAIAGLVCAASVQAALAGARRPLHPAFRHDDAAAIGRHLSGALPAGSLVATEFSGILPFHLAQRVLDTKGLNDAAIARSAYPRAFDGVQVPPAYVAGRAPEVFVPCLRLKRSARAAAEFAQSAFCDTRQMRRLAEHGYRPCVVRLAERRFFALWLRRDFAVPGLCEADPAGDPVSDDGRR